MHYKSRNLPSLDLIKGFEAAARNLSFTKAAEELFVTQSAISRQVKALEEQLDVALFVRRNRALLLTDAGQTLYRTAAEVLSKLNETTAKLRDIGKGRILTVNSHGSFVSLWLIPRLAGFITSHPGIEVRISANNEFLDLEREGIDLAIRYCLPRAAPKGAIKMFGEEVFPVCSPSLLGDRSRPLADPRDLRHHVLLHLDDGRAKWPWLNWLVWFETMGIGDVSPAGVLRFSQYDQMIQAAIEGQGVALGRSPLVRQLIRKRLLVAPFDRRAVSSRTYFIVTTAQSAIRPQVKDFIQWLLAEARQDAGRAS